MINVQISDPFSSLVEPNVLVSAAETTLDLFEDGDNSDLTISIQDDPFLQRLNLEYRQKDKPTDVLSFEGGEIDPETGRLYLGDIIISYDRAEVQAKAAGHPVVNELALLSIHGTLHLLGFDHADDAGKREMWDLQSEILDKLGLFVARFPEEE